jgi:toxin ParE1/3/4
MAKYLITNKTIEDLSDIWNYTYDKWSERQADFYYQMLIENFQEISDKPDKGKNYEGIFNLLFGLRAGRHIIFYRKLNQNEVEITRILQQKMDLKNRILE